VQQRRHAAGELIGSGTCSGLEVPVVIP